MKYTIIFYIHIKYDNIDKNEANVKAKYVSQMNLKFVIEIVNKIEKFE